jgi:hypothetical protein
MVAVAVEFVLLGIPEVQKIMTYYCFIEETQILNVQEEKQTLL